MPGDAVAADFVKTKIAGELIVCRECLIAGDVDADSLFEFWEQRARFILSEYGDDEIDYHEKVADELARLLDLSDEDEVNLWFEYELFCSVNLWFCIWLAAQSGATIYRVEPSVRTVSEKWKGFGGLTAVELEECFAERKILTPDDIELGADLWNAYRKNDHGRLRELISDGSSAFPYLKEVIEAQIVKEVMPKLIVKEIVSEGFTEFTDIFVEFTKRAGVYGYGDTQVERLLDG
jgi:hypothetical protein